MIQLPASDELNIGSFGRIFDNTSASYKYFWFMSILREVRKGKSELVYDDLVNEMIASAWYMVTEFHLNLGYSDQLQIVIRYISSKHPELKSSIKRENLIEFLQSSDDPELARYKKGLLNMVPYRLQVPLMGVGASKKLNAVGTSGRRQVDVVNRHERLMYYFSEFQDLQTSITISEDWREYLVKNISIVEGWLQYNLVLYLQARNPAVPGIVEKIEPPTERRMEQVKTLWKMIIDVAPVHEIYGNELLTSRRISIDHFVPWSYVANDELWNLHPTTKNINSSKSNYLPEWKRYFKSFSKMEYLAYQTIWEMDAIHKQFEKCADRNLNSVGVRERLYCAGLSEDEFRSSLEEIMLPTYQAAKNCGFQEWVYIT